MRAVGLYNLVTQIAAGSLCNVFATFDEKSNIAYSLQLFHPTVTKNRSFAQLLLNEVKSASSLQHPNILTPLKAASDVKHTYIVSPLALGIPLSTILRRAQSQQTPIPPHLVFYMAHQVANALSYIHQYPWTTGTSEPIVHTSICPRSVLVKFDGQTTICDTGTGRSRWILPASTGRLPYYPPERIRSQPPAITTDIYGLGLSIYDCLFNRTTFGQTNELDVRGAIVGTQIPELRLNNIFKEKNLYKYIESQKDLWSQILEIINRMISKDPRHRPVEAKVISQYFEAASHSLSNSPQKDLQEYIRANFPEQCQQADYITRQLRQTSSAYQDLATPPTIPSSGRHRPISSITENVISDLPKQNTTPPQRKLGRYILEQQLNSRGPAQVFRAFDPNLQRHVLFRTLDAQQINDNRLNKQTWIHLFKQEATYAASIYHARLPTLLDAGKIQGVLFSAYRFFEGQTLDKVLSESNKLPPHKLRQISIDICESLVSLHQNHFVHGDIRLSNILIDDNGRGILLDYSMLQPLGKPHPLQIHNLPALAPENIHGAPYDKKSEQFVLGQLLYQSLYGKKAFSGKDPDQLSQQISECSIEYPKTFDRDATVEELVQKMLSAQPENRFSKIDEILEILKATKRSSQPTNAQKPNKKNTSSVPYVAPQCILVEPNIPSQLAEEISKFVKIKVAIFNDLDTALAQCVGHRPSLVTIAKSLNVDLHHYLPIIKDSLGQVEVRIVPDLLSRLLGSSFSTQQLLSATTQLFDHIHTDLAADREQAYYEIIYHTAKKLRTSESAQQLAPLLAALERFFKRMNPNDTDYATWLENYQEKFQSSSGGKMDIQGGKLIVSLLHDMHNIESNQSQPPIGVQIAWTCNRFFELAQRPMGHGKLSSRQALRRLKGELIAGRISISIVEALSEVIETKIPTLKNSHQEPLVLLVGTTPELSDKLEEQGLDTIATTQAQQAWQLLQKEAIHAVVLGPSTDGISPQNLLRLMRANPETKGIRAITIGFALKDPDALNAVLPDENLDALLRVLRQWGSN